MYVYIPIRFSWSTVENLDALPCRNIVCVKKHCFIKDVKAELITFMVLDREGWSG
jgi:hypothetical protein